MAAVTTTWCWQLVWLLLQLRLTRGGLLWIGIPCSSWIWLSRGSTRPCHLRPRGRKRYPFELLNKIALSAGSATCHLVGFELYAGWWFGTFFIFPYIGNVIIPTDFHIFQRAGSTTNQYALKWVPWIAPTMIGPTLVLATLGPKRAYFRHMDPKSPKWKHALQEENMNMNMNICVYLLLLSGILDFFLTTFCVNMFAFFLCKFLIFFSRLLSAKLFSASKPGTP